MIYTLSKLMVSEPDKDEQDKLVVHALSKAVKQLEDNAIRGVP